MVSPGLVFYLISKPVAFLTVATVPANVKSMTHVVADIDQTDLEPCGDQTNGCLLSVHFHSCLCQPVVLPITVPSAR